MIHRPQAGKTFWRVWVEVREDVGNEDEKCYFLTKEFEELPRLGSLMAQKRQ